MLRRRGGVRQKTALPRGYAMLYGATRQGPKKFSFSRTAFI